MNQSNEKSIDAYKGNLNDRPLWLFLTSNVSRTTKGDIMNLHSFNPKNYISRNSNSLPLDKYLSYRAYYVTICTHKRQQVLEIPRIHITVLGKWLHLPQCFPGVLLDAFAIMPDHMQGILWLNRKMKDAPTLDRMIGAWKGWVTLALRKYHRDTQIPCLSHLWERGYYEHVIRNEEDLELTREYIVNNPIKALLMQEQRYEEMKRARARRDGGRP